MKPTFESTVDILVKAYLNDTLVHGYCTACAVGNIVAHSMGINIVQYEYSCGPDWAGNKPLWSNVFLCIGDDPRDEQFQTVSEKGYNGEAKIQIDSTGYTWQELAKIEFSFESTPYVGTREERMFNGLMAVVDVLADIHGIDLKAKEEAKLLFVKP